MNFLRFRLYSLLLLSILVLILAACTPDKPNPPANNEDIPAGNYGLDSDKMLQLINHVRAQGCTCGSEVMPIVPALTWNNRLATAAVKHSEDMNTHHYFDHTSQDGRSFSDRITAEGYIWSACGENIAEGYTTEEAVMDGWIHSPGHCKNIMSAQYVNIGAGRNGNYWTQDFGTKF